MTASRAQARARLYGLYAITPEGLDDAVLLQRSECAIVHGARVLQWRDKSANAARRLVIARSLARLCRSQGVLFIVNDDLELARAVQADGVHLGADDGDLAAARAALPNALIGASCYADLERARAAVAQGADYIAFGSVFASPTKPQAVRAPLDLFAQARAFGVPTVAIGGITRANCAEVRAAGAHACAVISDLFGDAQTDADEVGARARTFRSLLEPAAPPISSSS
jgi:thiamine-phosphate pyrophosphorylase